MNQYVWSFRITLQTSFLFKINPCKPLYSLPYWQYTPTKALSRPSSVHPLWCDFQQGEWVSGQCLLFTIIMLANILELLSAQIVTHVQWYRMCLATTLSLIARILQLLWKCVHSERFPHFSNIYSEKQEMDNDHQVEQPVGPYQACVDPYCA